MAWSGEFGVAALWVPDYASAQRRLDDEAIKSILEDRIDTARRGVGIVVGVIDANGRQIVSHGQMSRDSDRQLDGDRAVDHFRDQIKAREAGSLSRGAEALAGDSGRLELTGMLGWSAPQRMPFRRLLVHPVVVSRLNALCGRGFRLDHGPLLIGATQGTEGHRLHGAGEPFSPANWYHQQNGEIYCRGVTVAWQLADCNEGDGGFCIVPGSHKSCEQSPPELRTVEDAMGLLVQPVMRAGDVLFFAETATHGTLPWKAEHERRSVLYKYAARAAARAVGRHFTPQGRYGDWVEELTPEQRAVLYGPGVHHGGRLPLLESDGEQVRVLENA